MKNEMVMKNNSSNQIFPQTCLYEERHRKEQKQIMQRYVSRFCSLRKMGINVAAGGRGDRKAARRGTRAAKD